MHYGNLERVDSLTLAQQTRFAQIREEFFGYATSTITDRQASEKAISVLAHHYWIDSNVESGSQIHWVPNPEAAWDRVESIKLSSRTQSKPLYLGGLRRNLASTLIAHEIHHQIEDSLVHTLLWSLTNQYKSGTHQALGFYGSFSSGCDELVLNALTTTGRLASYVFYREIGYRYTPVTNGMLDAEVDLIKSAFALWAVAGHLVVCDKPTAVQVEVDCVVSMDFAD